MSRSKRNIVQTRKSRIDLDKVPDTSDTNRPPIAQGGQREFNVGNYEKVDPPFPSKPVDGLPFSASQIVHVLKIMGGVITFFITIVLPIVWYASKVDTKVDTLGVKIDRIGEKTENLTISSIEQREKIFKIEDSIKEINDRTFIEKFNKTD